MKYLIFIVLLILIQIVGQAQRFPVLHLGVEDGLPQEQVLSCMEDNLGRMWFGTNGGGIGIYDGNKFETINEKDGLNNATVYSLFNTDSCVYAATNGGFYAIYEDSITFLNPSLDFHEDRIFQLFEEENHLLLATNKGVYRFNGEMIKLNTNSAIDTLPVMNISKNGNNYFFTSILKGVYIWDEVTTVHLSKETGLGKYNFSTLNVGIDSTLVLSTYALFLLENKKLVNSFKIKGMAQHGAISEYKEIWLGSTKGLYQIKENGIDHYTKENGLGDNRIWKTFIDSKNNLWLISKNNGITLIKDRNRREWTYNDHTGVNAVSFLNDTIIAGDKGLNRSYLEKIKVQGKDRIRVEEGLVNCIYEWGDMRLIGFNGNGLLSIDEEKKGVFLEVEEPSNKRIFSITSYKEEIYLGTINGLCKIVDNEVVSIENDSLEMTNVYDLQVFNGDLYIASDNGFFVYDKSRFTQISDQKTRSIEILGKDLVIATTSGVLKLSNDFLLTYQVNLNLKDVNNLLAIGRNLWLTSNNEVYIFDTVNNELNQLPFSGTVINRNSIYYDGHTNVSIGCSDRLVSYHSTLSVKEIIAPKLVLRDIGINDFSSHSKRILHPFKDQLTDLRYYENSINIQFVNTHFSTTDETNYYYILDGRDNDWISLQDETSLSLSNLSPGNYTLKIKGNYLGKESNLLVIPIFINQPFWLQGWFVTLCILILLFGIWSYIKIKKINELVTVKNKEIELKNSDILAGIEYAKRLQNAILPSRKELTHALGEYFVLYQPKDIVSGDFYWLKDNQNSVLWSAVDCTGHGVPGAIVSMIAYSGLNRSVNEYGLAKPSRNLDKVNEIIIDSFNKEGQENVKDGMDMALCHWDKETNIFSFSGANNPCYIIRENGDEFKLLDGSIIPSVMDGGFVNLYELKGDKQPIGYFEGRKPFKQFSFELKKGDCIYISTDGYADQFGGPKEKKFKYRPFKSMLLAIHDNPMEQQKNILEKTMKDWQGELEQIDDRCIIGWKFNG